MALNEISNERDQSTAKIALGVVTSLCDAIGMESSGGEAMIAAVFETILCKLGELREGDSASAGRQEARSACTYIVS